MKFLNILSVNFLMAISFACLVAACGSDDSVSEVNENSDVVSLDGFVDLDGVPHSDSLQAWYLEQLAKKSDSSDEDSDGSSDDEGDDKKSSSSNEDDNPAVSSSSKNSDEDDESNDGKVHLLPPAGFYSSLTIPVPAATQGGVIRCTFNGAAPTENSKEFTEPYEVTSNTAVRCSEFVDGVAVRSSSHTFFIDEEVNMPVVAISVSPSLFANNYRAGCEGMDPAGCPWIMEDVEYPVHVEYFAKGSASSKKDWQIDAGLSLMGNWSRTFAKKSVAISMRKEYEDGRLKYSLFETRPENNKFKAFNLRNNGNRFVSDYIEDPMLTSLMEGSGVDYQRSRQVVVFYNGEYYGIHDMRERLNEHFVETNYGIDSKEVDMVKHVDHTVTANGGTADAYTTMLSFIYASDFSGNNNTAYEQVQSMMDVGNYADYMASQIYIHNGDWPNNNVRAWRSAEQPFKFVLFDLDHGFGWQYNVDGFSQTTSGSGTNMFSWIRSGGKSSCSGEGCFANIYLQLIQNPDFRRLFINRSAVMLSHYLTYEKVVAATDAMTATIPASEMSRDRNRFGRGYALGFDSDGYYLKQFAAGRTSIVRDEYRSEFVLGEDISVTIAAQGSGSVLLDGMKLPNAKFTGTFFAGNDMLLKAVPSAGATFTGWSDGSKENPRLVSPEDGSVFTAVFR